ncbi:hypothetical protein [Naasia lichenicola]|uniref:HNH endonuclease n=1 Tax=Naasia lichenicola TaxID=2565933 RepID=A0A4S4FNA6_9MICO|nr:hypothetical protein [Naasia lichenicola]THG30702.1 hypothetical protein E6C64_08665 [Naasia lichenicola]THG31939.1 hypothetical protein E6C64_07810 [Naasia lichenicola]
MTTQPTISRGKIRLCKVCGKQIVVYNTTHNKCADCFYKNTKPVAQRGKQARLWETFRDKVAHPYLDKKYGRACVDCGAMPGMKPDGTPRHHDVDHIKNKGSHPDLRFDVKNLAYRCRSCHIRKTDGKPPIASSTL